MHTSHRSRRAAMVVVVAMALATIAGCSGSSKAEPEQPTTSFRYLIDPLEPGTGFIQLGANRYPFDGVICTSGEAASDPVGSRRVFGVYANFEVDGTLAAVALTRYHNELHGRTEMVPTLTETALIQMQGKNEVRGLSAKRFRVVGETDWKDLTDPSATGPLIVRKGDRYEAKGNFTPLTPDVSGTTTTVNGTAATRPDADAVVGEVAARCPDPDAPASATTVDPSVATTAPAGPTTTTPAVSSTLPAESATTAVRDEAG